MLYIGADHRGYKLKESLKSKLSSLGFEVVDIGNSKYQEDDDYPDFAVMVAKKVATDSSSKGVVICGSGVGVDIAANKVKGVRCALVFDEKRAVQSRAHEDANVIALAADILDEEEAFKVVRAFLSTDFSNGERHLRRISKLKSLD